MTNWLEETEILQFSNISNFAVVVLLTNLPQPHCRLASMGRGPYLSTSIFAEMSKNVLHSKMVLHICGASVDGQFTTEVLFI